MSFVQTLSFLDNDSIPWKSIIIGISIGKFVFENYLKYRQYQVLSNPSPPKALKSEITLDVFQKSQDYTKTNFRFQFVNSLRRLISNVISIKYNILHQYWSISSDVLLNLSSVLPISISNSLIAQGLVFFGIKKVVDLLISLPFDYYQTFVIEEKFGFNKFTLKSWSRDKFLSFIISSIFSSIFTLSLGAIIDHFGDNYVVYGIAFYAIFILFIFTISPSLLSPLFYKFTPLEQGKLRDEIEELAAKHGFPSRDLYVIDGSSKSSHSNAFLTGLPWNKRIVLFDTLINDHSNEEVVAIVAHEFGHYKYGHTNKLTIFSIADAALWVYSSSGLIGNESLLKEFGFDGNTPGFIGYILFEKVFDFFSVIEQLASNLLVRSFEYTADKHAKDIGYSSSLRSGLIKLLGLNLMATDSDWLYSTYFQNHPDLVERLTAIDYVEDKSLKKD
ncbi:peptidase family M48-domain-containing protein [Scheffersomyces amazonensis]|uniref:peptidase family M48-domain-containing protein n=1 Tax=Scheffersomyces amazonensis TaxID=1078765 RepID=UPI00315D3996